MNGDARFGYMSHVRFSFPPLQFPLALHASLLKLCALYTVSTCICACSSLVCVACRRENRMVQSSTCRRWVISGGSCCQPGASRLVPSACPSCNAAESLRRLQLACLSRSLSFFLGTALCSCARSDPLASCRGGQAQAETRRDWAPRARRARRWAQAGCVPLRPPHSS